MTTVTSSFTSRITTLVLTARYDSYMMLRTVTGYKRACWNSWMPAAALLLFIEKPDLVLNLRPGSARSGSFDGVFSTGTACSSV